MICYFQLNGYWLLWFIIFVSKSAQSCFVLQIGPPEFQYLATSKRYRVLISLSQKQQLKCDILSRVRLHIIANFVEAARPCQGARYAWFHVLSRPLLADVTFPGRDALRRDSNWPLKFELIGPAEWTYNASTVDDLQAEKRNPYRRSKFTDCVYSYLPTSLCFIYPDSRVFATRDRDRFFAVRPALIAVVKQLGEINCGSEGV